MNFSHFVERLPKIKKMPLPGAQAQLQMAPFGDRVAQPPIGKGVAEPKLAAVLALIYPDALEEATVLLTLRTAYDGVHANQVALPGGKLESSDANLVQTALRETEEEVGIEQNLVNVIRPMTQLYIPPSRFLVQPYLGYCLQTPHFSKEEKEVAQLIPVRLREFMGEQSVIRAAVTSSKGDVEDVPAFNLQGHLVWGATAMMLNEIKVLFNPVL